MLHASLAHARVVEAPTRQRALSRIGAGAYSPGIQCQPGHALQWMGLPAGATYTVVPGYTYRGVVGVFGAIAKGAANASSVKSKAEGFGFTNVSVWTDPADPTFPADWASPPTAASLNTSDTIYYVQGDYTGAQQALQAVNSTLGQGAEVLQASTYSCQVAGQPPVQPGTNTSTGGAAASSNTGLYVGIAVAAVAVVAVTAVAVHEHNKHSQKRAA